MHPDTWTQLVLAALMACPAAGCRSAGLRKEARASATPADAVHILYYEWLGSSPGADFTRTDLHAVEIDFIAGQRRTVRLVARRPEPMIDRPGEEPPSVLEAEPWMPLPPEEDDVIRAAVRSWLEASPYATSDHQRAVGRESAYMLRFSLRAVDRTYRVRVNPPTEERVPMTFDPAYVKFLELRRMIAADGFVD